MYDGEYNTIRNICANTTTMALKIDQPSTTSTAITITFLLTVNVSIANAQTVATGTQTLGVASLAPVTVRATKIESVDGAAPAAIRPVATIDLESAPAASVLRIDDFLVQEGLAAWDAGNSLGLSTGLSVRGFASSSQGSTSLQAGRNFLNGHADLVWRFARDPATVSRLEFISGNDATLLGAGNPAASLQYVSKAPEGAEFFRFSAALGSNGLKRTVGDIERHWGAVQTRVVMAVQRDAKTTEGVKDGRDVFLLSNKLPWATGSFRYDFEFDRYTLPFPFGTAYMASSNATSGGGRFLLDQPYVDIRASAIRKYLRHALYLEQALGEDTELTAYWQRAKSSRDELLLGFFDSISKGTNANKLRGYYRTIDEDNQQRDAGLRLDGKFDLGPTNHQWAGVWQRLALQRQFAGPQNIGGFLLNATDPGFPTNLSKLVLSPRYAFEQYHERGTGLADTIRSDSAPGWELRLGLRRSKFEIDGSTALGVAEKRTAQASYSSTSVGIAKQLNEKQRVWVSRTGAFLPNRGKFTNGDYLPPSESHQTEAGWAWATATSQISVATFKLSQSNLPAKDPKDPDALILIGNNQSQGVELRIKTNALGLDWQSNATALRARVKNPTSAAQGPYLTGTPDAYGSLRVGKSFTLASQPLQAWARLQGAGSRPGDDKASFRAPGYGVVNVGLESKASGPLQWGLQIENLNNRSYVRALTGADNVWQGPKRGLNVWATWSGT